MPRVCLDPVKRRVQRIEDFIICEMKRQKIRQSEMAEVIGLSSQQAFSYRIKAGLSVEDFLRILDRLNIENETIGEILGYEKTKNRT